jgi:uncharacterized membrane protein
MLGNFIGNEANMTLYSLVVFAHVTSVLALFACLSLEALSLFRLRRASTSTEVKLWIEPVPGLSAVALGSLLVILVSGIYLTIQMSGFGLAWIDMTIGAFFLMVPPAAVAGKRMRDIRRQSVSEKANQSRVLVLLRSPLLNISLTIRIGVFLGIVLLMTAKPDLLQSLIIIGASLVSGLGAALLITRREHALSVLGSNSRR